MRQIRQRAAVRVAARLECLRRNQERGDEAAADQHDAHDQRRRPKQLLGVPDPPGRLFVGVGRVAADERHDRDAGLEPREAEGELRKEEQRHGPDQDRIAMLLEERRAPRLQGFGVFENRPQTIADNNQVESQIGNDECDGHRDRVAESLQEDGTEGQQQDDRHGDWMVQPHRNERVLHDVGRGVCGGEGDRDDEARRREPEEAQDHGLAFPSREQVLEHQDAALAVGAHLGDAVVHRQRAEDRDQHEDQRGNRRERAGGEKRDAGLIRQRRKVVDARQAHHLPPGGSMRGRGREVRPAARSLRRATRANGRS